MFKSDQSTPSSPHDQQPQRICRLPDDVINRIAAGEVVIRPSAALKELLENSLDAGSTAITVSARDGGLKLLSIADNGHGIRQNDLPLLCERYATSKIAKFSDLESVATFGFRGEALASISHVARLSVRTKTVDDPVGYNASFLDGRLRADPSPVAAVDGTTISVDDMFYNLPTRRAALRSPADEYRAIVDVVARYAIRYPAVAFVCRKLAGGTVGRVASADVRTESDSSSLDNIRSAFGANVANETMQLECDVEDAHAKVFAIVSTANFSMKKGVFILFINGRLVECNPFKKAILAAYSVFLPKGGQPFVYVNLNMRQQDIDVNVHPMKKEVRFLHESNIIEGFVSELANRLKGTDTSRTFLAQSVIITDSPKVALARQSSQDKNDEHNAERTENVGFDGEFDDIDHEIQTQAIQTNAELIDANDEAVDPDSILSNARDAGDGDYIEIGDGTRAATRTSSQKRKRQSFLQKEAPAALSISQPLSADPKPAYAKDKVRTNSSNPVGLFDKFLTRSNGQASAADILARRPRRPEAMPRLTSVENLLDECRRNGHKDLTQILKEHTFVGVVSPRFVLLQHGTRLLLATVPPLMKELMYQQALSRFADHECFELNPPAPLKRVVDAYLDVRFKKEPETTKVVSSESCVNVLLEKAPMLAEYFGMMFSGDDAKNGTLKELPLLFGNVLPDMNFLGEFLYRLAVDTEWSEEKPCFKDISHALSEWYGLHWKTLSSEDEKEKPGNDTNEPGEVEKDSEKSEEVEKHPKSDETDREWTLHHVIFASMRSEFYPPRHMVVEKVIREITSTSKLYRIFERC